MKPRLTMTFDAGFGAGSYTMCIDVDEVMAENIAVIPPPTPPELGGTMEECIFQLKAREFRKDVFMRAAYNLGKALAERMEDAEGWHDASRIEPAKAALRGDFDD